MIAMGHVLLAVSIMPDNSMYSGMISIIRLLILFIIRYIPIMQKHHFFFPPFSLALSLSLYLYIYVNKWIGRYVGRPKDR